MSILKEIWDELEDLGVVVVIGTPIVGFTTACSVFCTGFTDSTGVEMPWMLAIPCGIILAILLGAAGALVGAVMYVLYCGLRQIYNAITKVVGSRARKAIDQRIKEATS